MPRWGEALDAYRRCRPDWVLMDGFQVTEEILAFDPTAKVEMITRYNEQALHKKALRAGEIECVRKEHLTRTDEIMSGKGTVT